jgi:hypothetical protein
MCAQVLVDGRQSWLHLSFTKGDEVCRENEQKGLELPDSLVMVVNFTCV